LKNALRRIFADIDASAKYFTGGIKDDELGVVTVSGESNSVGNFAEHGFVQKIVFWTVERDARDVLVDAKFDEFKLRRISARSLRRVLFCIDRAIESMDRLNHAGLRGIRRFIRERVLSGGEMDQNRC
jgi:hypothetical protein